MRGKTHTLSARPLSRRFAGMAVALVTALALAGCSTLNLTGFDFPVFGLLKKNKKEAEETASRDGVPPSAQKLDTR